MGIYILLPGILGMGITAGIAITAVLLCRCLLKKGPKLFCYLLWGVVLFRLLCPVSIPSAVSVLRLFDFENAKEQWLSKNASDRLKEDTPFFADWADKTKNAENNKLAVKDSIESQTQGEQTDTNLFAEDDFITNRLYDIQLQWEGRFGLVKLPNNEEDTADYLQPPYAAPVSGFPEIAPYALLPSVPFLQENILNNIKTEQTIVPVWLKIVTWIWISGIIGMLIYSMISLIRLRKRLIGAVRLKENIYQSDYIASPFVIGVFAPKIYLPSSLCGKEQEYILMHEKTHLRRNDHIFRLLAFIALMLHWFNPLVWIAFYLSGKDMEMSCDESVMKRIKEDIRAEYCASLLGLATGRHIVPGTYLAFGEGDVGSRIRNVMKYQKPTVFSIIFAIVLVSGTICTFGSDPKPSQIESDENSRKTDDVQSSINESQTGGANQNREENKNDSTPDQDTDSAQDKKNKSENNQNSKTEKVQTKENEKRSLTIYSLTKSELVRGIIEGFSLKYPEIEVRYETGEEGVLALEQIDALTARLLAGTGPDVLVLDGLPAGEYQTTGLLADLGSAIASVQGELQENILSAYFKDGEISMLPISYSVPVMVARGLLEEKAKSDLYCLIHCNKDIYLSDYSYNDLLELLYYNYMPEFILPDGSVDEEVLGNFLWYARCLCASENIKEGDFQHKYFTGYKNSVQNFLESTEDIVFWPLCGAKDLMLYGSIVNEYNKQYLQDNVFFPQGLIGINAWSKEKELADLFVETAFSFETQLNCTEISGFQVNGRALDKVLENQVKENPYILVEKHNKEVVFAYNAQEIAKDLIKTVQTVDTPCMADTAVLQIIQEEAAGYLGGSEGLKDCIASIAERILD